VYLSTHAIRHIKSENSRMQDFKRNLNMVVPNGFIAAHSQHSSPTWFFFSNDKANFFPPHKLFCCCWMPLFSFYLSPGSAPALQYLRRGLPPLSPTENSGGREGMQVLECGSSMWSSKAVGMHAQRMVMCALQKSNKNQATSPLFEKCLSTHRCSRGRHAVQTEAQVLCYSSL